ncbi:MAG: riboflavin synthase [Chitinophagaceae bacterium]|nr:riboflavin synthase [Chitinophagaceae bacterium]
MFTGIVESTGEVYSVQDEGTNKQLWITSPLSAGFKADQSVAHNGICLTVEKVQENRHRVTAVIETIEKTTIGHWKKGDLVNLEQCVTPNNRLDGHIVQGHVDTTAVCIEKLELNGSRQYTFRFPDKFAPLIIEKGSVCVNGISLTAFDVTAEHFSVAIIPYTYEHTNMKQIEPGATVNIEFDMIGKYVVRGMELRNQQ